MDKYSKFLLLIAIPTIIFIFESCSSTKSGNLAFLDKSEILKFSGLNDYPDKSEYPGCDAVILYDIQECEIITSPYLTSNMNYATAIKVFKNIDDFNRIPIPLTVDESLVSFNGRVISPDGKIKYLDDKNIIESTSKAHRENDVEKSKMIYFPDVHENSIIEYNYTIRSNRFIFGYLWFLQSTNVPVLYSESRLLTPKKTLNNSQYISFGKTYKLDSPSDLQFDYLVNLNNIQGNKEPEKTEDANYYKTTWKFKNIPALMPEQKMPPIGDVLAAIQFRLKSKNGWQPLASVSRDMFVDGTLDTNDFVKHFTDSLTQNCNTEEEKIIKIKNYAQAIRYEAVEYGYGGIEPRHPEFLVKKQYGDCKDKAAFIVEMLKSQGIKAYPAIVLTASAGTVNPSFPLWKFNHMIAYVEGNNKKDYWIDGTVTHCKLGEIPSGDQGINALILYDNDRFEFKSTPVSDYSHNKTLVEEKINVINEDSVKCSIKFTFYGDDDINYRNGLQDLNDETRYKFVKRRLLKDEFANVKLENIKISDFQNLDLAFTISFDFDTKVAFTRQGKMYFLNFDPINEPYETNWLIAKERTYPIYLNNRFSYEKHIEIVTLSDKFQLQAAPDNIEMDDDNYAFSRKVNSDGSNKILASKKFESKQIMIDQSRYNQVKNFLTKIAAEDKSRIIFQKTKN